MKPIACCLLGLSLCVSGVVHAQTQMDSRPCGQENQWVFLDALRVVNCLIVQAGVDRRPVVTDVRQRIENIGAQPVVVEVTDDYFKSGIAIIFSGGDQLSRKPEPPRLHDKSYVPPRLKHFPLPPGKSVVFTVPRAELLERIPQTGISHTIFMPGFVPYLYAGEPELHAGPLRRDDARKAGQQLPLSKFEGVLLR